MDTFRYFLAVLLMIGLPPGLTWWFFIHPFVHHWRKLGARLTFIAMILFFASGVAALALIRDTLLGPDLGLRWPLFALGLVLVAGAAYISRKRKGYLTMRILVGLPEMQPDAGKQGKLLEEGPYAMIRHPRYVEIVLATFGYASIANYLGCWVLAVLSLPVIHLVVLLEERELTDRFGEAYREYAARVPRYLPSRSRSAQPTRD